MLAIEIDVRHRDPRRQLAARLDSIPEVGDWIEYNIFEKSVLVVHTRNGVKAFHNACRHRGNAVCRAEEGHATSFMCTYHGWTYDLKGVLIGAPVALTLFVAFLIGVTLQGGYNGMWPLAASVYPEARRATGIGWAMAIGRGGAVIGPLLGGYLMTVATPLPFIFVSYCVPLLLCAAAASFAGWQPKG